MGGASNIELLYYLAEHLKAENVIETGVAYGWSALAILLSLSSRKNARLISTDMPYPGLDNSKYVGCVIPNDLKGKWTHIKLHVLWKKDDTGRFIIYKNNEIIADLKNIKTLADTCNSGYLKLGIYRHRTIGYWNSDWESLQDQTVYYDNIVFRKPKKDEKIKNK